VYTDKTAPVASRDGFGKLDGGVAALRGGGPAKQRLGTSATGFATLYGIAEGAAIIDEDNLVAGHLPDRETPTDAPHHRAQSLGEFTGSTGHVEVADHSIGRRRHKGARAVFTEGCGEIVHQTQNEGFQKGNARLGRRRRYLAAFTRPVTHHSPHSPREKPCREGDARRV